MCHLHITENEVNSGFECRENNNKFKFPDSIVRLSNVKFHFVLSYVGKSGNQRQHAEGLLVLA